MISPLDPFSEVVDENRRWTREWYSWLRELIEFVNPAAQTVVTLPAASAVGAGARRFVTDATATTFLSVVAGGGANSVPVVSDGTNWLIG